MKIKGKILIPIFVLVFLAVLAIATIPPPPVNQNFGIYDTMMTNYDELSCKACHQTSGPDFSGGFVIGVPTRHHSLVGTSVTNLATNQPFVCVDCHPSIPGMGILLDRNCIDCHNGTAFWGNSKGAHVGGFTRPHHNTTQTQTRNCKFCHGASVDDYNDEHYIPSYPESEKTPSALFKVFDSNSGRVWGGCLACHAEDALATPAIHFTHTKPSAINGIYTSSPIADEKNNSHHNGILGITAGTPIGDQCLWCHANVQDPLDIRGCETCHSVRAIHNIQVDSANTSTKTGYGHIGSDVNNRDCNGCHTWYDINVLNPFAGAIIPDVQLVTPGVFTANIPTIVTLSGTNFIQTDSTTVVNIDDTTTLIPDTITNGQITVTVNLAAGVHYIKVVETDITENVPKPSGIKPLTVASKVTITSAKLRSGIITISGSGFGNKPKANAQQYVTINRAGNMYYSDSIIYWGDNKIKVKKTSTPAAVKDDIVTIVTANSGEASAKIVESINK